MGPSSQWSLKASQWFWGHFWPPWDFFYHHRVYTRIIIGLLYDRLNISQSHSRFKDIALFFCPLLKRAISYFFIVIIICFDFILWTNMAPNIGKFFLIFWLLFDLNRITCVLCIGNLKTSANFTSVCKQKLFGQH